MCESMVDIQSTAAEIRREKKEEEERNHRMKIYMVCPITQGDHKQTTGCRHQKQNFPQFTACEPGLSILCHHLQLQHSRALLLSKLPKAINAKVEITHCRCFHCHQFQPVNCVFANRMKSSQTTIRKHSVGTYHSKLARHD